MQNITQNTFPLKNIFCQPIFYSDVDIHSDTDSSSTIEDQENEDFNGDWEREAIAELNKQRHKSTSAVPSTFLNTQTNFASNSAPSLKAQRNLAKFNKTSKKLKKRENKKSKKEKSKQKPGNCLVQWERIRERKNSFFKKIHNLFI